MTTLLTQTLRAATLGILLSCSVATYAADGALEIETKVPATLSGTLGYASMKYWVEVPGKGAVELWYDSEDMPTLDKLLDKTVSLDGFMVTYSDGSVYFQPKMKRPPATFTVSKNSVEGFDVLLGGDMLTRLEDVYSAGLAHQFAIPDGQVALLELNSGGTACPITYQLIVVRKDSPTMTSEEFGTCSDMGKLTPEANGFTLNLPGNPDEHWVWDASSLMLRKHP